MKVSYGDYVSKAVSVIKVLYVMGFCGTGFFGTRHTFAVMAFLGLAISYMLRVNLSVAIVDMVNRTQILHPTATVIPSDANSSSMCTMDIGPVDQTTGGVCLSIISKKKKKKKITLSIYSEITLISTTW